MAFRLRSQPVMQSMLDYLDARHLNRSDFIERFPHAVLLLESHPRDLERRAFGFNTEAVSSTAARAQLRSLTELKKEGKRLSDEAESTLVFPVQKRPDSPFADRITIGRTQSCDVMIADRRVSKMQAYFEGWMLIDAGSKNGTRVNGRQLQAHERVAVRSGDRIEFPPFCLRLLDAGALYDELKRHILATPANASPAS